MEELNGKVEAVRRFNRTITQRLGVLQEGLYHSNFSLTEARLIYELYHLEKATATALAKSLELDLGYLSRLLSKLEKEGIIQKIPSEKDSRKKIISLTSLIYRLILSYSCPQAE